jgi:peptidoglycan/xylan/chitin deacetylase (PgdA/CDA1 family)
MKLKKYICASLITLMIFAALPIASNAENAAASSVNAEIMTVYGGVDGIISMTFDDGYYETALVLDELFEKYDLKGSLMMIGERSALYTGKFQPIFDKGRLEPQSHSMSHIKMTDELLPAEGRDELFEYEIAESAKAIHDQYPDYDILTFAIPYGDMSDDAYDFAAKHYYGIRTTKNGVQTLDPDFSRELGSWSKMYSPVTYMSNFDYAENPEEKQWQWIKTTIDNAANGWYLPITHRVGDVEDTDLTYAMADKMFAYIAQLKNEGKVWVTTYSEAVKYVRERQNSTVRAYTDGEAIYVDVTMAALTEDGLPLDTAVFDTPLTVKVEVPATYGKIYYTVAGQEYTAEPFSDGSGNYVYVNIAPGHGPVKLRVSATHTFGDWNKHSDDLHKRYCTECGLLDYDGHTWDEGEITKAPTHTKTGTKECACVICGETAEFKVKKTDDHTFDKKVESMNFKAGNATCTSGETYYYSCVCGACGTETFELGDPLGHSFGEWRVDTPPTATTAGRTVRECDCGEVEYGIVPATGEEQDGGVSPILIGAIGAGVLILAAVAVLIIKKKKKA